MEHARSRSRSRRRRRQTSQFPVVRRSRRPAATDHLLSSAAAIERVRSRRINSIISLCIMSNGACESVDVRVQQSVGVLCCEWIYMLYMLYSLRRTRTISPFTEIIYILHGIQKTTKSVLFDLIDRRRIERKIGSESIISFGCCCVICGFSTCRACPREQSPLLVMCVAYKIKWRATRNHAPCLRDKKHLPTIHEM